VYRVTARKSPAPTATGDVYEWPEYPDDPTLGGAITAEMFDALQGVGSGEGGAIPPDPEPEPES